MTRYSKPVDRKMGKDVKTFKERGSEIGETVHDLEKEA